MPYPSVMPYDPVSPIGSDEFPMGATRDDLSMSPRWDSLMSSQPGSMAPSMPRPPADKYGGRASLERELSAMRPNPMIAAQQAAMQAQQGVADDANAVRDAEAEDIGDPPQPPQLESLGKWMGRRYPQYAGRRVSQTLASQLKQQYVSEMQAKEKVFEAEMARFQAMIAAAEYRLNARPKPAERQNESMENLFARLWSEGRRPEAESALGTYQKTMAESKAKDVTAKTYPAEIANSVFARLAEKNPAWTDEEIEQQALRLSERFDDQKERIAEAKSDDDLIKALMSAKKFAGTAAATIADPGPEYEQIRRSMFSEEDETLLSNLLKRKNERMKSRVPSDGNPFVVKTPAATGGQNPFAVPAITNPDGSTSTERTITVEVDDLNGGKPTLIPTIVNGKQLKTDAAIKAAVQSGLRYPAFNTIEEADVFARQRSAQGGAGTQGFIGQADSEAQIKADFQTKKITEAEARERYRKLKAGE